MSAVKVQLPDGSVREFPAGSTARDVAAAIGRRLEEASVAAKIDDKLVDLTTKLPASCRLALVTRDSKEGLEVLRHSAAHLFAQAVQEVHPGTQITIGPVIEDGFYYDIDCPKQLTADDLPALEKRMTEIVGRKLPVARRELPREEAVALFQKMGELYKVEIVQALPPDEVVSVYGQGDFVDLCRGPHIPSTDRSGKFKLLSVAGAYWRGDETKKMLQRVYGTAFASQKELDEHLARLEEAKRRDHRKLGPEMGYFTFLPIAPAMPFYLPRGAKILQLLQEHMRKGVAQRGFQEVACPQLMSSELWKISGHWDHYREDMFLTDYEENKPPTLALKPMNCPGHMALFASDRRSYRDLPLRFSEMTRLHRNERGGVTHGLLRTRTFSQDDGHIFCTEEQIAEETASMLAHTFETYDMLGFDKVVLKLATRPEKYLGTLETWARAEGALEDALKKCGRPWEFAPGEGVFYGPKIEFHVQDSLHRSWQCGTVQVDYQMPERFGLEYVDSTGAMKRPVVLHRAILGSFERFFGILIEHHAGHLPFWLAPTQAVVLNVTDAQADYGRRVKEELDRHGIRTEIDNRNEKLGYKIREMQLRRVPLMVVIGQREQEAQAVSLRWAKGEKAEDCLLKDLPQLLAKLQNPIDRKEP